MRALRVMRRGWQGGVGLGMNYNMSVPGPNAGLQVLQRDLMRVGFLPAGSDSGRWDQATEDAVIAAARQLGYGVTVGCTGCTPVDKTRTDGSISVYADLLALIAAMPSATATVQVKKTPWLLIGGGVLVVGAAAAVFMMMRRRKAAVVANRRRRNRR